MAPTQGHLDALQEALASGTMTVTFQGRSFSNCGWAGIKSFAW